MTARWLAVLLLTGCSFAPELSRFPPCEAGGGCPPGAFCLAEAQRCVPLCELDCDAGADAGVEDAGAADAGPDGGEDGGFDGGVDAGPQLALATRSLPPAVELRSYSERFVPTGGVPPYAFSIDGGVPNFTLGVDGTFSTSTAPAPGTFAFTIVVRDDDSPPGRASADFSLEVRPLLRVASHDAQIEGRTGQGYSQQLSATGGTPPYTWSLDGGSLPPGVGLSPGGLLSGSPSSAVTRTFQVAVSDAATPPQTASRTLSLEVKALTTVLTIATSTAADGRVGTPYSQPLKAYGGTQPYNWSLSSGALPAGVTLADTGTDGRLAGTPLESGSFTFTVRCADTLTSQSQTLTLLVY